MNGETNMTKLGLLGAAAVILSSALAGPAMAQQAISHPANCKARYPNANCTNLGPGNPYTGSYQRHVAYRNGNWHDNRWDRRDGRWERRDSGISPGDVAADAVGGAAATVGAAVGTAGAIAAAPFDNDSYAYYNGGRDRGWNDNGWNNSGWNNESYAQRNGFVCTPGTWFKGEDGRRHLCQ
jgi:hypothetical protein